MPPVRNRPVNRGEAEAILQAFGNAGRNIAARSRARGIVIPTAGNPADPGLRATIRPFSIAPFDGRHYCAQDWHVIVIAEIDGGDRSFTVQDAERSLGPLNVTFTLDDIELTETERTPIHDFLDSLSFDPTFERAFFFQQGKLFAPDELAVGQHSLSVVETTAGVETFRDSMSFFIDAVGEGVCVEPDPQPS